MPTEIIVSRARVECFILVILGSGDNERQTTPTSALSNRHPPVPARATHQRLHGAAAGCCPSFLLTCALLMTSLDSKATRKRFSQLVWVSFGQTPILQTCQAVAYFQLTGKELPPTMSTVEHKQALNNAFANKNVLLILDDVWEREHAEAFVNALDDNTGSKVLLSSRVRGVLEGGTIVDIHLPSDEDAVAMLMREAGFEEYVA